MNSAPPRRTRSLLASWLLIAGVWLVFFWPVLGGRSEFGYRDTASMYHPVYQWMDQQWQRGQAPLWNPLDDFGMSLIGDSSSGMFYPAKLLFFLPIPSFDIQFAWFVAGHVLLAAAGAWRASRCLGCQLPAATLVAISYAFGGAVVFQTCNLIYLAGSAWLPFVLAGVWTFCHKGNWTALAGAAVSLAMMVLAGDPQMAYVGGLVALFLLATSGGDLKPATRVMAPVVLVILALALAAIQLIPSIHWTRRSERMIADPPVTMIGAATVGDYRGLISEPVPGTHTSAIYEFSFAPWRVVESIWPNVFGSFDFVTETTWSSGLPGADRLWTPSIYFGVIVVLLACGQLRFRRPGRPGRVYNWQLSWIAVFFLVASFGWYGIGWLVNELQLMRGGTGFGPVPGRPVGGLYWLMVGLFPGFSTFRYPAKLVVVAVLAACLLGGFGLERLSMTGDSGQRRSITKQLTGLVPVLAGGLTAAVLALAVVVVSSINSPLNVWQRGAAWEILVAVGHSCVVLIALASLLVGTNRRWQPSLGWLVAGLTAVDVTMANVQLQGFVRNHSVEATVAQSPDRLHRDVTVVPRGPNTGSPLTLAELRFLDRYSLRPRYHLEWEKRVTGSFVSIEPLDLVTWKRVVAELDIDQQQLVLQSCGIRQIVQSVTWSRSGSAENHSPIHVEPGGPALNVILDQRNLDGTDRYWLTHQWTVWPEIDDDWPVLVQRTRAVIDWIIQHDIRHPVLESGETGTELSPPVQAAGIAEGTVRPLIEEPGRTVLGISASEKCLLVCCDYYDPGWQATIQSGNDDPKSVSLIRANRVLRAIPVPPGQHRVELRYRPPGFVSGLAISGISWLMLVCGLSILQARALLSRPAATDN